MGAPPRRVLVFALSLAWGEIPQLPPLATGWDKASLTGFLLRIPGSGRNVAQSPIPLRSHAMHLALFLQQNNVDQAQIMRIAYALMAIMPILFIVCMAIVIVPFWFICKKAGFSPWLSLLNIVPFGAMILWYVLAFAEWKVVPA